MSFVINKKEKKEEFEEGSSEHRRGKEIKLSSIV
jgi:hypothetical protein